MCLEAQVSKLKDSGDPRRYVKFDGDIKTVDGDVTVDFYATIDGAMSLGGGDVKQDRVIVSLVLANS